MLASICTFLWWFSEPGLLHNLCLNVMFICSVSTVVFNANPLLRYDGYYILADLIEIPNLRQKATTILSRKLSEWCLGLEPPDDPFLPQRNQVFFVLYSIAAAVYRWVVAFSICWFLYRLFQSYHLEIVGQMRGGGVVVGVVRHAALSGGQVLLRAREDRTSEKAAILYQPGRAGGRCCWRSSFCRCRTA